MIHRYMDSELKDGDDEMHERNGVNELVGPDRNDVVHGRRDGRPDSTHSGRPLALIMPAVSPSGQARALLW